MNFYLALFFLITVNFFGCYSNKPKGNFCSQDLIYETNTNTAGENAIKESAKYSINLYLGQDNQAVLASVDTATENLIIDAKDFAGTNTTKDSFVYNSGSSLSLASISRDEVDMVCGVNIRTNMLISASEYSVPNTLGLGFGNKKNNKSFFGQLVKDYNYPDMFSLALCGFKGRSNIILGGYDHKVDVRTIIPIIEKSSFVMPAVKILLADSKRSLGNFPKYDPLTKTGIKTILDSASAFLLLPVDMAERVVNEITTKASDIGIIDAFPSNFFSTQRGSTTKTIRFANEEQIRQFPKFEIEFLSIDGQKKYLELSPEYYFKAMDKEDPLVRTFAIRHTQSEVVLGQPFMENHYMLFDRQKGLVSFGDIDQACKR